MMGVLSQYSGKGHLLMLAEKTMKQNQLFDDVRGVNVVVVVSPMLMPFEDTRKQHSVDCLRSGQGRRCVTLSAPSEVEAIERCQLCISMVVEKVDLGLHQLCS